MFNLPNEPFSCGGCTCKLLIASIYLYKSVKSLAYVCRAFLLYFEPDVPLCPECQVVQPSHVVHDNGHDDTIYRECSVDDKLCKGVCFVQVIVCWKNYMYEWMYQGQKGKKTSQLSILHPTFYQNSVETVYDVLWTQSAIMIFIRLLASPSCFTVSILIQHLQLNCDDQH